MTRTITRNIQRKLAATIRATLTELKRRLESSRACGMAAMRAIAKRMGLNPAPVGDGNAKTDAAGTYGKIEGTCAKSCPYRSDRNGGEGEGCYAEEHHTNKAQQRAPLDVLNRSAAWLIALHYGKRNGKPARLHVSGDIMMPDGVTVDWLYVETVAWLSAQYGAVGQWGYTHAHVDNEAGGNEAQARFAAAGLIVRRSDSFAPGGAVVAKFERFAELRAEHGRHLFKCPAQLSESMTCAKCTLCWTRPELTVVFDPHGARAARIEG